MLDKQLQVELPTIEELQLAIKKAKGPPHNLTSSMIKHTDHGARTVRHYLCVCCNPSYQSLPLDTIRIACENLSKAGREPGKRKRTPEQKLDAQLRSIIKAYPPTKEHTAEYDRIHNSPEYKNLRDARKRALDYRCQLCCRFFGTSAELEGHILDYANWSKPGMMLILCREQCHPLADALRIRGQLQDRGEVEPLLF